MSILVFDAKGSRVHISDGETYRGPYVDSPQTLARIETTAGKQYTVVLDQHEFPLKKYTFTLSTFSDGPVEVREAVESMAYLRSRAGAWTRRTAGGSGASATYFCNPQFRITLKERTSLAILLSTDNRAVYVRVDMVWAHGQRVTQLRTKDLVASSGDYRRGCVELNIPTADAGAYSIVCSTFEAGQVADFVLRVNSKAPIDLSSIPAEAAGKIQTLSAPLVFPDEVDKLRASLSVSWLARASVSVRTIRRSRPSALDGSPSSSILRRLSVVMGWGPNQVTLAVSGGGDFEEPSISLQTPEFDMEPERLRAEGMWLLVEALGLNRSTQTMECVLHSDSAVQVGSWESM